MLTPVIRITLVLEEQTAKADVAIEVRLFFFFLTYRLYYTSTYCLLLISDPIVFINFAFLTVK